MIGTTRPSVGEFVARLRDDPCCAAIVAESQLAGALTSRAPMIVLLRGNGLAIGPTVERIQAAGKLAAIHLDLIDGVHADVQGVAWLARSGADAIITSHGRLMTAIRDEGVIAIQRLLLSRRTHLDTAFTAVARVAARHRRGAAGRPAAVARRRDAALRRTAPRRRVHPHR